MLKDMDADAPRWGWSRNPDVWGPVLLVLLGILFFADPVFTSKNYYYRDILNFHYPLRRFLIECYSRWEVPLWNPFLYFGQPLLANPNYMALYPTNLLHLLLPFNYAFKLHFILHPVLAGLGLYFFQRRLGLSMLPSFAGAIAYEFSGTVLSFMNLYNIVPAVALLPWIAWAFVGSLKENWLRRSLIFGGLLALQVIALEPLMFLCNVWLLVGISILHILEAPEKSAAFGRALRTGCVGSSFAFGLAAVQILPTMELLPRSSRGPGFGYADASIWSVHPLDLVNTFIPNLFGNYYSLNLATSWGESIHNGYEDYLVSCFLGTCVLILAALSFGSRRRKLLGVTVGLALVSLALAFGKYNPVNHWLFDHVPFFGIGRYPSKYLLLTTLAVSLLAALGFELVLGVNDLRSKVRRAVLLTGAGGMILGLALLMYRITWQSHVAQLDQWISAEVGQRRPTKDMPEILAGLERSVLASGGFLFLTGCLITVAPLWKRERTAGGLVLLIMTAELLPANLRLSPLTSDADVNFVPEVNRFLGRAASQQLFRVSPALLRPKSAIQFRAPNRSLAWLNLFYRMSGQPADGILQGIQYSLDRSVDHLGTRESEVLWQASSEMQASDVITLLGKLNSPVILSLGEMSDPRIRRIAAFGTESDTDLSLYWVRDTVPRAMFIPNVEIASSRSDAFRRFTRSDFDASSTVVLEDPRLGVRSGLPPSGTATVLNYEDSRVVCRVESGSSGYLVVLDSYYPGWKAILDGAEVDILRADYAFRAVPVPPGRHVVESRYRPKTFFWGLAITLTVFLCGAAAAMLALLRRTR